MPRGKKRGRPATGEVQEAIAAVLADAGNRLGTLFDNLFQARLRETLAHLAESMGGPLRLAEAGARAPQSSASTAKPGRRKIKLSPKAHRLRKLQGQYMGALRGLSAANKSKVKAEYDKTKDIKAAIAHAKKLKAEEGNAAGATAKKPAKAARPKKRGGKKKAVARKVPQKGSAKKTTAEAKPKGEESAASSG